jgi:hypothetical protein
MNGIVAEDSLVALAFWQGAVVRGDDGFGDVFAGETGAGVAVAGVENEGGDLI